jgi:hypothetical protein
MGQQFSSDACGVRASSGGKIDDYGNLRIPGGS